MDYDMDMDISRPDEDSEPAPAVPDAHSPRYNADEGIDLVLIHPEYGEIPYTARDGDPDTQAVYDRALAGGYGEIAPYVPEGMTPEALQNALTAQIQQRLDDFARTRNYDGILSACTYATSSVPKFYIEGQYCVEARDATWAAAYAILDEVMAGTRAVPQSMTDIDDELPALAWPE